METKSISINVKALTDEGQFSGLASTFGNIDLVGDVIQKGAFAKTIKDRKGKIRLLWQHNRSQVIGTIKSLEETDEGLFIEAQLALGTQLGKEAHELLKMEALDSMSIGFSPIIEEFNVETGINTIKEIKLFETSLVTFPANEQATVGEVKEDVETIFSKLSNDEKKEVISYVKTLQTTEPIGDSTTTDDSTSEDGDTSLKDHSEDDEAVESKDDSRIDEDLIHCLTETLSNLKR